MAASLELVSTVTDRYQTTVPSAVRRALKLGKRGKIRYSVQPDGVVLLRREEEAEVMDPVVEKFLAFLGKEMQAHPERIKPIDPKWMRRAQTLVKGVKFDINKPLDPANE